MNGKQLKNSILQWAIQGKLVPQDPNDEPASVLLEKIRAEKARLVKEGKIKKDKKESIIYRGEDNSYYEKFILTGEVKCIDDEIPFELPKGWEWCRLGTIFQTSSGTTPQSNNPLYYKDGDINWIRTTDLNNEILRNAEVKITEQACVDYKLKEVPINAVCIAMYGGAGTIGKHALIQFRTTINQSVCAIHPNIDCSSKFLHIFIQYQRPYWMDFAAGSRKAPNINQLIIQHCLFPLPPLAEQQRIVAKIEELMPLVEQYGKAQSELEALNSNIREQLKKSILQYAIEGKLVPQCEKDGTAKGLLQEIQAEKQRLYAEGKLKKKDLTHSTIFRGEDNKYYEQVDGTAIQIESDYDFPNTWAVVKLSHICRLIDGEKKEGQYICLDAKYLRGKSTGTYLDKGKFVAKGNNIILVDGENSGEVFTVLHDGYMGSTFKQLWVSCSMHLPYVLYFIQFYKDLLRNSKKGAAIPHLNKEFFYSLIIGIPPFQEQKRIANAIEELYARL
ncbi:restriction endonuclease subunit S [Prevotella denticola]|uniref:restriction endonuclease subunit S n=1 Tax=Prevotella denticola TaxID=28129 RepID=UPI001BC8504E|nr:restriction endonuclease subunit S [Prevotella denticola]QUI93691.1 restriction endonuclease subunit S [Prevotella denticola]